MIKIGSSAATACTPLVKKHARAHSPLCVATQNHDRSGDTGQGCFIALTVANCPRALRVWQGSERYVRYILVSEPAIQNGALRPGTYARGTETVDAILHAAQTVLIEEGASAFTIRRSFPAQGDAGPDPARRDAG
jgi:DTW domain-containing protein YfiP